MNDYQIQAGINAIDAISNEEEMAQFEQALAAKRQEMNEGAEKRKQEARAVSMRQAADKWADIMDKTAEHLYSEFDSDRDCVYIGLPLSAIVERLADEDIVVKLPIGYNGSIEDKILSIYPDDLDFMKMKIDEFGDLMIPVSY